MAGNQSYDFGCVLHFHQGHRGQQLWDIIAARLIGTRELDWRAVSVNRKPTNDWLGFPPPCRAMSHQSNRELSTRRPYIEPLAFSPFDELRLRQQVILEDAGHSFIATEDMGKASHQVLQSWRATNPSEARKGKVYATDFFSHMPRNGKNQVGSMCPHVPLPAGQALYGGGSYQNGLVNYKGVTFLQHVAVSMN